MVTLARRAQRTPFAPVAALMFGVAAAILVGALPVWMFEHAVTQSGLPTVLAVATPPLGLTARLVAVAAAFVAVTGILWLVLTPLGRALERDRRRRTPWQDAGYAVEMSLPTVNARRRPIFAPDELGAPLMSDEAIAPTALPPLDPEPALEKPLSAVDFGLPPSPSPADDNSIHALIRRLESGLARRAANDPGPDAPSGAPLPLSSDWIVRDTRTVHQIDQDDGTGDLRQALGVLRKLASR